MSLLLPLIFGVAIVGSVVKCELENIDSMSTPQYKYKDGINVYIDRLGRQYINGEYCYEKVFYDSNHERHLCLVGSKTGKTYHDYHDEVLEQRKKEDKEEIQYEKGLGKGAYLKYFPEAKRQLTVEMKTKRVIAKLEIDRYGICRKYYAISAKRYRDEEGDGIEITKEELKSLNIGCGSHYYRNCEDPIYVEMYKKRTKYNY